MSTLASVEVFFVPADIEVGLGPLVPLNGGRGRDEAREDPCVLEFDGSIPDASIYRRIGLQVAAEGKGAVGALVGGFAEGGDLPGQSAVVVSDYFFAEKTDGSAGLSGRVR